jgi:hypothetical protein
MNDLKTRILARMDMAVSSQVWVPTDGVVG